VSKCFVSLLLVCSPAACGGQPDAAPVNSQSAEPGSKASPGGDRPAEPSRRLSIPREASDKAPPTVVYRRYMAALDAMTASGGRTTGQLETVAAGAALRAAQDEARVYTGRNLHTEGRTVVVWARTAGTKGGQASVRACLNSKAAQPLDGSGHAAMKAGAPTRWLDEALVRRTGGTWKVVATRLRPAGC
jgi:hypothetical protein